MIDFLLHNLLAYSEQIAILIAVAAFLAAVLKLTASARLHCFQLLLACGVALPFIQPWRVPAVKGAVVATTILLSDAAATVPIPERWTPSLPEVLAAILVGGVVVRLSLIALGMLRLHRYIDGARLVPTAFPIEKERTGVWPDIFISEELKGPVTFGLFRPAVLVPLRWIDNETIAYHELLHVRRRDWAFTIVEECVRAILWFHPAVWWLIGQIQLAREEVVDRRVVQLMQSRELYLDTLLAIAEAKAGLDLAPAPLFLKQRHLRQRVAALLKEVNMSRVRISSSLAGFTAILVVAGWMATRSFPLHAAPQAVKDAPGVSVHQDESKVLHRSPVRYPASALEKGIQGTVVVETTIDQNGEVTDAQVISGPSELRKAALESVLEWHYNKDLGPPSRMQVAIDFVLPAGAPSTVRPTKSALPANPSVVNKIDLSSLPQPLRDNVSGRLSIHVGDHVSGSEMAALRASLAEIDSHLHLFIRQSPDDRSINISVSLGATETPSPETRIRVGGNVQALNLISKVTPAYPPLAKQARVQGTVRFTAYIAKDGHVTNLELVSGHPLLIPSATEAVQQWIYKPTLLNGNPVDVVTQIDVNYTLSDDSAPPPPADK